MLSATVNDLGLEPGEIPVKWHEGSGGDNWRNENGEFLTGKTIQRGDVDYINYAEEEWSIIGQVKYHDNLNKQDSPIFVRWADALLSKGRCVVV